MNAFLEEKKFEHEDKKKVKARSSGRKINKRMTSQIMLTGYNIY
jgi:hypothetical protein